MNGAADAQTLAEPQSGTAVLPHLRLHYERFGAEDAPAIVLIMGLGMQLIAWPDNLCRTLVAAGYQVIRFDNRDAGLTEWVLPPRRARLEYAFMHYVMRRPISAAYLLEDLARDTFGLIDHLGLKSVHIVGASMGGMVAQIMAAQCPDRIASMTVIMSSSGERSLPWPRWPVLKLFLTRPRGDDKAAAARHFRALFRVIGAIHQPEELKDLENRMARAVARAYHPNGTMRQMEAILASGDRRALLKVLRTPTLVIHGANDPLVPPAHGHRIAALVPGARCVEIPEMGHYLPQSVLPALSALILEHAAANSCVAAPATALAAP